MAVLAERSGGGDAGVVRFDCADGSDDGSGFEAGPDEVVHTAGGSYPVSVAVQGNSILRTVDAAFRPETSNHKAHRNQQNADFSK